MKKYFLIAAMLIATTAAQAEIKVEEPEFINSYYLVTSDSTLAKLPKENGKIGKHQNKVKGLFGKIGGIASAAGIAGSIVGISTTNVNTALGAVKTVRTATSVGMLAEQASVLAGADGMDVIFEGVTSDYAIKKNGSLKIIVKEKDNNEDPINLFRVTKFKTTKKERYVQWLNFDAMEIDAANTKKGGYVPFTAHKYGNQSYILEIPEEELEKGEYGIFYMSIASATSVPVGTFSIK